MTSKVRQSSVAKILNTCYYRNNRRDIGLIYSIKSNWEIMCCCIILSRKKRVNKLYTFQYNSNYRKCFASKLTVEICTPCQLSLEKAYDLGRLCHGATFVCFYSFEQVDFLYRLKIFPTVTVMEFEILLLECNKDEKWMLKELN